MNKRKFLTSAALLGAATSPAFGQRPGHGGACVASPVLLTVSGAIKRSNRGPLDPALDQMLAKHLVKFDSAYTFDFPTIAAMPAVTIKPTLEYDARQHTLRGPLLADVLQQLGAPAAGETKVVLRAVDGYAVMTTLDTLRSDRFILATQIDGKPLPLGGLGPLWAVYDADNVPEMAAKPLKERFVLCPWGLYQIQVTAA
ncbi:MAG TPA: molybdopterin-dependent oxidoreductase [Paraburkholderia sp.]|nr:molybdopterin-dependent oxidoreductase [Paraburkholderia sp.]